MAEYLTQTGIDCDNLEQSTKPFCTLEVKAGSEWLRKAYEREIGFLTHGVAKIVFN